MAVVKAPALSLDASGNLGAICYSSWRGLNIARDVWTGTDPNTLKQQAMRAKTKAVVQYWGGALTEEQREAWRVAALSERRMSRIKTVYMPSGFQFFVQLNIQRKRLGSAIMNLPPAAIEPYTWQTFRLGYNYYTEVVNLHFENELNLGAGEFSAEIWQAGPYNSGGRHALDGEYRFLRFIKPVADDTVAGLIVGKYYWFRARVIDDYGRVQGWFEEQILIQAKESGQIVKNSEFIDWTGDDPDKWDVFNEDANNYITEAPTGAKIVGIVGGTIFMQQYIKIEENMDYKLRVENARTTGAAKIYVINGGIYYVGPQYIVVDVFEREFTGGANSEHTLMKIWKATADNIIVILNCIKIYKLD